MGLKPYDRNITQIFNNVEYDIDFYQREYKWNDKLEYKPVSSLLNDIYYRFDLEEYNPNQDITIENINKLEWYYLNTFLTNMIKGKRYIVDGQQRLTTLTLMSIGLYHLSINLKLPEHFIDSLKNSILGNTEFGKTFWMGFNDRNDALNDLLVNNLNYKNIPNGISEENIYTNYKLIFNSLENKFNTSHKLQTFITYFRHRIFLIEIEIDKDKDVAMVFEVINDRGISLKPYEIIKGKLLSQIDIADREKYIDSWENQIKKLEEFSENQIDNFFGFYFQSKFSENSEQYAKLDKTRYHKTIFTEEFNVKIGLKNNESNVREFLEKILPYFVDLYVEMLKYEENYEKEYENIYFNGLNEIDGQFLLTMSSIKLDDEKRNEKLKLIPKYFDRLFVLSNLTNNHESKNFNPYIILLNTLLREKNIDEANKLFDAQLLEIVKKKYERKELDNPFKYEFFKNVGYNSLGKKFQRYFFARIDHFISEFSDLNEFGTYYQLVVQSKGGDVYHIEHIISNNKDNLNLFTDEEEFNAERNRLGALLLLKGRDNESSGDELYPKKLKTYSVIGTYYARTLLPEMYHRKIEFRNYILKEKLNFQSYSSFGKQEIEERHSLLFELVKRIWE